MTVVLPLAHVDDLLFHCVVAVGGAHLSSRQSVPAEVHGATIRHYSFVLRILRTVIHGLHPGNANQILRILLALALTGSYEVCIPVIWLILAPPPPSRGGGGGWGGGGIRWNLMTAKR